MKHDRLSCCVLGPRSDRMPLAYPALAGLFAEDIALTGEAGADIVIFGHPDDLVVAAEELAVEHHQGRGRPVVYLSEEPFWDTIGPLDAFQRRQVVDTPAGPLPIFSLTHQSSAVFAFDRVPYFLLTDPNFAERYAQMFAANSAMSVAEWRTHFAQAPMRAAFLAENRLSPKLDLHFDGHDVRGLCTYRTELAIRYRTGPVLRAGRGWSAGSQDRIALPDWHLDKLRMIGRRCVFVSALENTHHPSYVSEKIFDAFAVGGVPIYYASPGHAVHRACPEDAWLNAYGLTPQEAAQAIDAFVLDNRFLECYRAAQAGFAQLFADRAIIAGERERVRDALVAELHATIRDYPRS